MAGDDEQRRTAEIRRVARARFGFESFRPGQEESLLSVLEGRDTLAVMATGSGKSAIYQIAGLLANGPTVVVSPLIALQRDQSASIQEQDMAPAAIVNTNVPSRVVREAFEDLREGELEFLFLAPEQFNNREVLGRIQRARPSLFVVDEAHCISEWGHNFRPEYLRLGEVAQALGGPTILALTATATLAVQREIIERLGMRRPRVVVRGFDRPNIWLGVKAFTSAGAKSEALLECVEQSQKPGIVYVGTRKHAETIAEALLERGEGAVAYHAGLKGMERNRVQQAFMEERKGAQIIVATTAFGMGVDKPNIRFVFHYDISESIDAYYQEIGRAGRDGQPAQARLFYRPEDLTLRRFFAGAGRVKPEQVRAVGEALRHEEGPVRPDRLQERTSLSATKLTTALRGLEDAGVLRRAASGELQIVPGQRVDDAVEEAVRLQERRRNHTLMRIETMRSYAELATCRRRYLLTYFGEEGWGSCGRCDNCAAGRDHAQQAHSDAIPVRSWVRHKTFGRGLVLGYEQGRDMLVLFEEAGHRRLSVEALRGSDVLEPLNAP